MECHPCKIKFSEFENYEQHLKSEKHKKNMLSIEEKQNDSSVGSENSSSSEKNDKEIKCFVCDLSFNSLESFQNHSATPAHALQVMLQTKKTSTAQSSNGCINNHELNIIKPKVESTSEGSILPELNDSNPYGSYGSCDACKKVFSGPEPYKQHLESQGHKKKVSPLQNSACIAGNPFKCEPCQKLFSGEVPYTQHMISETHKKKLQNLQFVEKYLSGNQSNSETGENGVDKKDDENKLWFCNICQIQCSGLIPYQQHIAGTTHFKHERRMQFLNNSTTPQLMNGNLHIDSGKIPSNFAKADNSNSMMPTSTTSYTDGKNGNYQNGIRQDNSLLTEEFNELKIVTSDELSKLVKIISTDQKINFDEVDMPKDLENEKPDIISQNEKHEKFREIQGDEDGFADNLKKTEGKEEFEVFQTCTYCKVELFDKDSAAEHFESEEHFKKRWGLRSNDRLF